MKPGIKQVLEKTISGVVIAENDDEPKTQMFLTFTDGTHLEFYGDWFTCRNDLDRGGIPESIRYIESNITALKKISVITQKEEMSCNEDNRLPQEERKKLFAKAYNIFRDKLVRKGLLPKQPAKH